MYDMSQQTGGQAGTSTSNEELFNMMFGGGQQKGKGKTAEKPKMQPTKRVLDVTLEKIYTGGVVELHHERARLCGSCDGRGGENIKKCPICKG
jgi:DnaJ family protein A protein 2